MCLPTINTFQVSLFHCVYIHANSLWLLFFCLSSVFLFWKMKYVSAELASNSGGVGRYVVERHMQDNLHNWKLWCPLKLNWTLWGCHFVVLAFNVVFKITFRPQSRLDVTRKCIFSLMRESNIWSLPDNLYWVFQDPRSFWTCFNVFPRYIHCIILQVVKFESSITSHTISRS